MKPNPPTPSGSDSEAPSDRNRLIRLLAALLARRWWKEEIRKRDGETADRNRVDRETPDA